MPDFDYHKGFVVNIKIVPMQRVTGTTSQQKIVHAQLLEAFEFGRVRVEKGQTLCGLPAPISIQTSTTTLNSISCKHCRKELDRWSRDAHLAKCKGYALIRGGKTTAVAARSNALAATLLGVNPMFLLRNGVSGFGLKAGNVSDDLDCIRDGLATHGLGVVIEQRTGEDDWHVVLAEADADRVLLPIMRRLTNSGNTPVQEARKNRSIRLSESEKKQLAQLGGVAWIRERMSSPLTMKTVDAREASTKVTVFRATDAEWERFQSFGGANWLCYELYATKKP